MHLNNLSISTAAILLFFFWSSNLLSSHIVGGEISYTYLKHNPTRTQVDYEVTLTLYRDPFYKEFNLYASFGIFEQETWGAWKSYEVINSVPRGPILEVSRDDDPCKLRSLTDVRLQSTTYTFELTLDVGINNYLITYQEGFRNYSINNIVDAGNVGSVYDVLVTPEALRVGSSSPKFKDLPPIFICAGYELDIDNSATDIDGDEIIYSFCAPTFPGTGKNQPECCGCAAPNPELCLPPFAGVTYVPPYSATDPFGNQTANVNSTTGIITGIPAITGSYVIGVCIEEYRNGILLSETKRDFVFNAVNCSENLVAKIDSETYLPSQTDRRQDSIAYFETCNETLFDFVNLSGDLQFIQEYKWQFFDSNNNLVSEEIGAGLRDLSEVFPSAGYYKGMMILNDGATCFDTAFIEINIIPEINPLIEIDFDSCVAGPVTFNATSDYTNSSISWKWQLGDGNSTSAANFDYSYPQRGIYQIELAVEDDYGCKDEETYELNWNPYQLVAPDTMEIEAFLCFNDSIFIYNEWVRVEGTYFNYLPSQFTGCDSIVERITVSIGNEIPQTTESMSICPEDEYFFNNEWLSDTGIFYDTLRTVEDCDSIIALLLSLYDSQEVFIEDGICEGETYVFGGVTYSQPGEYSNLSQDINGCDSLTQLDLALITQKETTINEGFCENSSYNYNGELISIAGSYTYDYVAASGCDSIVTLILESYNTYTETIQATICEGGFYQFGEEEITSTGDYLNIYDSVEGCDSIVVLNLEVIPETSREYRDTICLGETYAFGEINLNLPGIYYDTITNSNGCDSLIILDLIVGQNLTKINVKEALELEYGESIVLTPDIRGGDLLEKEWSEIDEVLSYSLELDYLVENDEWIYFASTNDLYCVALDSVFIRAILEIDLYFPNVITPDGDGINDIFNVGASETLVHSQLTVFDRWGNLMYQGDQTDDRQITTGWDGTYKGRPVQNGAYTFMLEAEFIDGSQEVYGGEVTVIR